jgi:hypothetical protein
LVLLFDEIEESDPELKEVPVFSSSETDFSVGSLFGRSSLCEIGLRFDSNSRLAGLFKLGPKNKTL